MNKEDTQAAKKRCEAATKDHLEVIQGLPPPVCADCQQTWPCDAIKLAADLPAALEALEEAQKMEGRLWDALDLELEAVESSIKNLEQCPSEEDSHCNDVTRVHDRLLRQRNALDHILSEEGE